jgi:multiple sugar transport system substrate-binding protein
MGKRISRRDFVRLSVAVGATATAGSALLSGCTPAPAVPTPAPAGPTAPPTKRKIVMPYNGVQWWDDQAAEFTKATGIDMTLDHVPFPQLHDKCLASFMAGSGEYDVVHVRDDFTAEWAPKGWLEPLDTRITDALRNEHFPGAFNYLSYSGKTYGVPRYNWLWQFYYNTVLFDNAGIKEPPKTWEELRVVAKQLTKAPQYGLIFTYGAAMSVNVFTVRIRAEGGDFMKNGLPVFNTPDGVASLKSLIDLQKDGSVDPSSFELPTTGMATDIFTQGNVAMCMLTPPTLSMADDVTKSKVVGKVKVALLPGSKLKSGGYGELGGIAITSTCKDKDAAWEFIKFATNAEQQKLTHLKIGRIPTRPAVLADPDVMKLSPAIAVMSEQMKYPSGMAIVVPQQAEINTAVGNELVAALRGQKTAELALADAEKATLKILGR